MPTWFAALIPFSALWVYLDASKHRIGVTPNNGSPFFNLSAGAWGVATLLLWVVSFPAYLIKRSTLQEFASRYPVDSPKRTVKAIAFGAVATVWSFLVLSANSIEQDLEVESTVAETEPSPEEKMEASVQSYKLLVLERARASPHACRL